MVGLVGIHVGAGGTRAVTETACWRCNLGLGMLEGEMAPLTINARPRRRIGGTFTRIKDQMGFGQLAGVICWGLRRSPSLNSKYFTIKVILVIDNTVRMRKNISLP